VSRVVDLANDLLGPTPAELTTASAMCPDGVRRGVMTIRTPSTTLTVYLTRASMLEWARQMNTTAAGIPAIAVADANGKAAGP
jgi:hypothetical protein